MADHGGNVKVDVHDGGGHQHHAGCSHDHGGGQGGHSHSHGGHGPGQKAGGHGHGGKGGMHHQLKGYGRYIRIFFYTMATSAVVTEIFLLNQPLYNEADNFEYWFHNVLIVLLAIVNYWSYYQASNIKSVAPKVKEIPQHSNFNALKNEATCEKCSGRWKPLRTHHCSICNECILCMDHHCPWTDNCVGAANHRAFTLFCTYLLIGSIHYFIRSFSFAYHLFGQKSLADENLFLLALWAFTLLMDFPMTLMVMGLSIVHFLFLLNNMTTLENMGNAKVRGPWGSHPAYPMIHTIYDAGYIGNWIRNFGTSYFTWWMPLRVEYENDGTYWQNNATIGVPEYQRQMIEANATVYQKAIVEGIRDYSTIFKQAESVCEKKHMQFNDRIYEWK